MSDLRYICNLDETPELAEATAQLDAFKEREKEQLGFIKRQVETLREENLQRWQALWNAAQKAGKIPEAYKYDDYTIQRGGGNKMQMFIEPDDGSSGMPDFLKRLIFS